MIINSQRTLFAIDLEQHMLFNQSYTPLENTTLNEKFRILVGNSLAGVYPTLNMFVIGIGGLQNVEGEDGYKFSQHSPLDGALFEHVPFIVRDPSNDLTATEKANYRLRVIEMVNNREYVCYYGKVIPKPELNSMFYVIKTINDTTSSTAPTMSVLDTTSSDILNPKPKARTFTYDTIKGIDYVTKMNKIQFSLSVSDISEIKSACEKLGKSSSVITELGICTSCDYEYNNYTEAVSAQIAFHVGVDFNLAVSLQNNEKIQKSIEIGGLEPFIK